MRLKQRTVIRWIRWISFGAVMVCTMIGFVNMGEIDRAMDEMPKITTKEELAEALAGPSRTCVVRHLPLTGRPAEDPQRALAAGYLAIHYQLQRFVKQGDVIDGERGKLYDWSLFADGDVTSVSKETYLCETVPLDITSAEIESFECLSSAHDFAFTNEKQTFGLESGCYYPDGENAATTVSNEERVGQERYRVFALTNGTPVTFVATVGDGKISVYTDEHNAPYITTQNRLEALEFSLGDAAVNLILVAWVVEFWVLVFTFVWKRKVRADEVDEVDEAEPRRIPAKPKKKNARDLRDEIFGGSR